MSHHLDRGESLPRIISFAHRLVIEKYELSEEKIKLEKNKKKIRKWLLRLKVSWFYEIRVLRTARPFSYFSKYRYQTVRVSRTELKILVKWRPGICGRGQITNRDWSDFSVLNRVPRTDRVPRTELEFSNPGKMLTFLASPLYFKCQQCGCMNSVTFPSMMMLPTVQAVPQESLAPVVATKPKPVSKPNPKTYALPPPPKPPQIIAQQGPELLQKDRPMEKRELSNESLSWVIIYY